MSLVALLLKNPEALGCHPLDTPPSSRVQHVSAATDRVVAEMCAFQGHSS